MQNTSKITCKPQASVTAQRAPVYSAALAQARLGGQCFLLPPLTALTLQALLVLNSLIHRTLHLPKAGNPSPPSPSLLLAPMGYFLPALASSLFLTLPKQGPFPPPNCSCRRADGRGSGFLTCWECASLYRH